MSRTHHWVTTSTRHMSVTTSGTCRPTLWLNDEFVTLFETRCVQSSWKRKPPPHECYSTHTCYCICTLFYTHSTQVTSRTPHFFFLIHVLVHHNVYSTHTCYFMHMLSRTLYIHCLEQCHELISAPLHYCTRTLLYTLSTRVMSRAHECFSLHTYIYVLLYTYVVTNSSHILSRAMSRTHMCYSTSPTYATVYTPDSNNVTNSLHILCRTMSRTHMCYSTAQTYATVYTLDSNNVTNS